MGWARSFCQVLALTFPMCWFGSVARKMTTVVFFRIPSPLLARFENLRCVHSDHDPAVGLDEHGRFRTRALQAYPPDFCRELADHIYIMDRGEILHSGPASDLDKPEIKKHLTV